jgi:hypothetical protein
MLRSNPRHLIHNADNTETTPTMEPTPPPPLNHDTTFVARRRNGNATYRDRPTLPEEGFDYVEPTLYQQRAHHILDLEATRYCRTDRGVGAVVARLYLGSQSAASQEAYDSLMQANIRGIVNCTTEVPCYFKLENSKDSTSLEEGGGDERELKVKYCQIPVHDMEFVNILTYLQGATTFIDAMLTGKNQNDVDSVLPGSVLVHCQLGVSRSATIVIAYLMRFHDMTRDEAYIACKKKRPCINPNPGFWNQLATFERWIQIERQQQRQVQQQQQQESLEPNETPTTSTVPSSSFSSRSSLDKQWAERSNAVYCTCVEIPHRMMEEDCWQDFLQHCDKMVQEVVTLPSSRKGSSEDDADDGDNSSASSASSLLSHFLFICFDFCWGRGVLDVDLEWLCFILQHLEQARRRRQLLLLLSFFSCSGPTIGALALEMITKEDSEFNSYWSGEVFESQIVRFQAQLTKAELLL